MQYRSDTVCVNSEERETSACEQEKDGDPMPDESLPFNLRSNTSPVSLCFGLISREESERNQ